MASPIRRALFLLAVISAVSAYPATRDSSLCTEIRQRVPWSNLAKEEEDSHIQADLCLIKSPSKGDIPGAVTRWDDLQWPHVVQTDSVHIVTAPERLIKDERGYTGRMPYADPLSSKLSLDSCPGYWDETADNDPHGSGHGGLGGIMSDLTLSPGDPSFYLHHSWLDKMMGMVLFQESAAVEGCQIRLGLFDTILSSAPESTRSEFSILTSFPGNGSFPGGNGLFPFPGGPGGGGLFPGNGKGTGPEFTDYFGDDGSITTLSHRLFMAEIFPNTTMADVMDIGGDVISSEYLD
ncbi:amino acid transporter [Seiridium cupressi]